MQLVHAFVEATEVVVRHGPQNESGTTVEVQICGVSDGFGLLEELEGHVGAPELEVP